MKDLKAIKPGIIANGDSGRLLRFRGQNTAGFTLAELVIGLTVLGVISISVLGLYISLVNSATIAKRKAVASTLATNQVEYLKSLPYNNLAVAGGSIISSNPLPASTTQKLSGVTYTIKTSINYVDDAFDGCGPYPDLTTKQKYCRNYPPPSGAPATDLNPADYKIIHVSVYAPATTKLAEVDTQISSRVAETASNTGALFVKVLDPNGNPVSGATVQVINNSISPQVNVSDSSDSNGTAIFFGLPPDTSGYDYNVTASLSGYSTITTIPPSGSLQPNYPNLQIFTQLSSSVTLTIKPQGADSLLIEAVNTSGNPISGVKIYAKGGYKKYTDNANTAYYYDSLSPSDSRPTTDANGMTALANLVPGSYIFCGDSGNSGCASGTTYYLAAAVPYSGVNSLNPITVPTYIPSSPPTTTFPYGGHDYLQKVRLILSTSSTYPRLNSIAPYSASQSGGGLNSFDFHIDGVNLPCSSNPASCSTSVQLNQGANSFPASCTGSGSGLSLDCTADLSLATLGMTQLEVSSNGHTLTLPGAPMLGGIDVVQ